jgi:hypothetical protein
LASSMRHPECLVEKQAASSRRGPPRQRAHRPRPDGSLRIVARGERKDEAALIGAATA